jgi:thiol-disulfide isomerase/thioredoxin
MFICNHCPYVQHVKGEIGRIAAEYRPKGVGIVAINSNDITAYPDDSPENMKRLAESEGWTFPFLFDETQEVAKAFRAACTPEFYLFGPDRKLVYRGQLDDSRPRNNVPVTGRDLRAALDAVLSGRPVPEEQTPSVGCNIKWRKGNEPEYFKAA